jgi:hypothetical protein
MCVLSWVQTKANNVSEQCSRTVFLNLMRDEHFLRTFTSWRILFVRTFAVP